MQSAHTALERGHTDDTSVLKHSPDVGRHCSVAEIVSAELQSSVAIKKTRQGSLEKEFSKSFLSTIFPNTFRGGNRAPFMRLNDQNPSMREHVLNTDPVSFRVVVAAHTAKEVTFAHKETPWTPG